MGTVQNPAAELGKDSLAGSRKKKKEKQLRALKFVLT